MGLDSKPHRRPQVHRASMAEPLRGTTRGLAMISDPSGDGAFRQGEPPIIPARYLDEPPSTNLRKRLLLMFLAFAAIGVIGAAIYYIQRDYWPRGGISRYNY